jgi:ABC-2 type transport system ATP-binding protein
VLEVCNLYVKLGNNLIVKDISFKAQAGDIIGLIGVNGAGKTTIIRAISGVLTPNSGKVLYDNQNLFDDLEINQAKIGTLLEGAPLYDEMNVKEFYEFIGEIHGIYKDKLKNAIINIVTKFNLENVFHQKINTLSKGYKRRVAFGGVLIHDPRFLIFDEPMDGLDPNQKLLAQNSIKELAHGRICIISTHDLQEVTQICTRIILINNGQIICDENIEEFKKRNPENPLQTFYSLTNNGGEIV